MSFVGVAPLPAAPPPARGPALVARAAGYPRIGNLWGQPLASLSRRHRAQVTLWLGADGMPPATIRELRRRQPAARFLASVNAVESSGGVPSSAWLRDVDGGRIEVWPGTWRVNLTDPAVADLKAAEAVRALRGRGVRFDGVFFDNVFTSQSWQRTDIFGRPVQIDANRDGKPDDPATLDAAWRAGVVRELRTFRRRAPRALVVGHAQDLSVPEIVAASNGTSRGFDTADVIEGQRSFEDVLRVYQAWSSRAHRPRVVMLEGSPIDQLAYGYGFDPAHAAPPATIEFGRTYYPWMRFGLALTLLGDGWYTYEWGDAWHGTYRWYDEYDANLGRPLGPARRARVAGARRGADEVRDGGFERGLPPTWVLWYDRAGGARALAVRDAATPGRGRAALRVDVARGGHVELNRMGLKLRRGVDYRVSFLVRSDAPRTIRVTTSKGSPPWTSYGSAASVQVSRRFRRVTLTFRALATAADARLQLILDGGPGAISVDDVTLRRDLPQVFRRDYARGAAIVNATSSPQRVLVGPGYRRLRGAQAPRLQRIVDDAGAAFAVRGPARDVRIDSNVDPQQESASGPYYHAWAGRAHLLDPGAVARYTLHVGRRDAYGLSAWWPAGPQASGFGTATYRVLVNGRAVVTRTLDQRRAGDQFHWLARFRAGPRDRVAVELRCTGTCVADALSLWSRGRYNDGSPARVVTLAPFDGIVLRRARRD
jgi:Hypothetical glycosyl hydrolase family 15